MKRLFDTRALAAGTAIAVAATGASFALAGLGFGNLYYVSVFMPFAMLGCLAVAWFMFLRDDGFAGRAPSADRGTSAPTDTVSGTKIASGGPGGLDASFYAPRDDSIIDRAGPGSGTVKPRESGAVARAALVWAAVELGAAAAVLYSAAGLGSSFYR